MINGVGIRRDERFELGSFELASGHELPGAFLAYSTYGALNSARDNVIVAPTWFAGTPETFEWLIGPGEPLDTDRYFIVAPSMFGNGLSSSPSNTPPPFDRSRFPHHTIADNVRAQGRLLTEHLEVTGIEMAFGGSMGAMQAFEWAIRHPDLVKRVFAMCGASKVSEHCSVFLGGAEASLMADATYEQGEYDSPPLAGLRAVARNWAAWSPSARFFRDREFEALGFSSSEQFVTDFWEPWYSALDANNFLNQLWTWQHADPSAGPRYAGDLKAALGSIQALTYLVPGERDPYFPVEDAAWEVEHIARAELHVIPGTWGHFALFGSEPTSAAFIRAALRRLLEHSA